MKWIPLESNIVVMDSYAKALGFQTNESTFHDVYGTEPELLAMVSGPCRAVVLLFPTGGPVDDVANKEGNVLESDDIFWMPQTIGNACGTMGLIHALANAGLPLEPSSPIGQFIAQARKLPRKDRSQLLESTELFADAHIDASSAGQAILRDEDADTQLHFTTFVQADIDGRPHLIELNGNRAGPVSHGPSSGNLLSDAASFIKDHYMAADPQNVLFNMMALAGPAEDD